MQRSPTEPTLSAEAADPARGRVAHVVGRPPLGRYRSAMPARSEIVEVAGRQVTVTNPDKVFFAGPGYTKRDLVGLLPGRGRRRAAWRGRPADGPEALRQRRRGRVLLPEARARIAARVDSDGRAVVPVRSNRRRDRHRRRGRAGLGRQPRLPGPQPARDPGRRPGPPRRAARGPGPGARRALGRHPPGGAGRARGAGRPRAGRLAQDVRLARHPRQRPDRAALVVRPGPAGRAGAGPRGRAARPGDRLEQVVEGRAPRRLHRLQPERQGSNGRVGLLGPAGAGRAGLGAGDLGRAAGVRAGRLHAGDGAGAVRARSAIRRRGWTRPWGRWTGCSSCPRGRRRRARATRRGRPTTPRRRASRREWRRRGRARSIRRRADRAGGRASPRPARPRAGATSPTGRRASTKPLIEIARAATKEEALAGFERWKSRHAGRRPATCEPADVLVDGDARPLQALVPDPRQPGARAGGGAAGAGAARRGLRPVELRFAERPELERRPTAEDRLSARTAR